MGEDEKCCGNCRWMEPFIEVCCNGDSESYCDSVSQDDVCDGWEPAKKS